MKIRKLKRTFKSLIGVPVILGALVLVLYAQGYTTDILIKPIKDFISEGLEVTGRTELSEAYRVLYVIDGDTIAIDYEGQETRVRLIGIDTPESVNPDESKNIPEGKIASDYTKSIITDYVHLEFDQQKYDNYGRLLAYVYLSDGTMLNEKIVADGYAYTMNIAPNIKHQNLFLKAFDYARTNNLGLWKEN